PPRSSRGTRPAPWSGRSTAAGPGEGAGRPGRVVRRDRRRTAARPEHGHRRLAVLARVARAAGPGRPGHAVVLFEDETIPRWFPPRRHARAFRGTQAVVPITGNNA